MGYHSWLGLGLVISAPHIGSKYSFAGKLEVPAREPYSTTLFGEMLESIET